MYDSLFSEMTCAGLTAKNRVAVIVPPEIRKTDCFMQMLIIKKLIEGGAGLICAELSDDCPRHELDALCKSARENDARIFLSLPEKAFAAYHGAERAIKCGFDGVCVSSPAQLKFLRFCFGGRLRIIFRAGGDDAGSLRCADILCLDENSDTNTLGMPVIRLCDGISPRDADALIASGRGAFVAPYRSLISDTDWCKKAQIGDDDAIRPCIRCRGGCGDTYCAINPCLYLPEPTAAKTPCRIAVIGGGAASLSFALSCAERGHAVDIFESGTRLGGSLGKYARCEDYLRWLTLRLCRMPEVQIFTGSVFRGDYDTVVCAADAEARPLPELEPPDCVQVFAAEDFLSGKAEYKVLSGKKVAVTGGDAALEVSERLFLTGIAKSVTLISEDDMPCAAGIACVYPAKPLRFSDGLLLVKKLVTSGIEPSVCAVSCDAVIFDTGYSPSADKFRAKINGAKAADVYYLGGAVAVSDIACDIRSGYELAAKI